MKWKQHRVGRLFLALLLGACFLPPPAIRAVVFFSTGDPEFNTTPPAGALTNSGWELQGLWHLFLGTPVSSNFFISAKHVGGAPGAEFILQGRAYPVIRKFEHPSADLTLWKVSGVFTNFAPIYANSNEVGRSLVVFGRGRQRGPAIYLNGEHKGWEWGNTDFRMRWGENVVSEITDRRVDSSTNRAQTLRVTFDTNAGPNEAHLSNGDSGGAVFIQEDGVWKLAGINSSVDGSYNTNSIGKGFDATLFDERGFYRGSQNRWQLQTSDEIQPGAFYATRISAYQNWIHNVITHENPKGEMSLEHSRSVTGPFSPAFAQIDGSAQTVRLPRPASSRFYRLRATEAARITTVTNLADTLQFTFE